MMLGLSLAPGDIAVRRAAGGGASLLPQTEAWLAALTTAGLDHPTAPHIAAVDTFYSSLISAGIYASLDLLPCFFLESSNPAHSEGVALMDLIALQQWAPVNGPTFTPGVGFAGDGVAASVDWTHANYADLGNYALNSASLTCGVSSSPSPAFALGMTAGSSTSLVQAGGVVNRINVASSMTSPAFPLSGYLAIDRPDSGNATRYVDGAATSTQAYVSSFIESSKPRLLGTTTLPGAASIYSASFGASLGDAGQLALYNAIQTLKGAVA
ncbi:hypothetical protein JN531_012305 [Flagellatimonas centrodinii]|uniref:hypothetical protein n=1 Tax=Flagellatimonas centrodinii TaxID=2806210 RepID=UPI001FEF3395|nr:hypothetical protein [Flagellatimonas centrodinii]ULQ45882.1 hypothetical protein JN531_012305 [Flagellatimonas centrodinii]